MARQQIKAQPRTITGKKVKRLRRDGLIPGVVYGPAVRGTQVVSVSAQEFERVYERAGTTTVLDLSVDGGLPRPVLIHQVQHDYLRRHLIHVDFLAPDMLVELIVSVPLATSGESPAIEEHDGILTQLVTELQVRCLPDAIPHVIEIDLAGLKEIGAQVLASDLVLPAGVTLVTPEDELLVKIDQPQLEVEEDTEAEDEAVADGAEGEGGATGADNEE